jgi:hypothetical protein
MRMFVYFFVLLLVTACGDDHGWQQEGVLTQGVDIVGASNVSPCKIRKGTMYAAREEGNDKIVVVLTQPSNSNCPEVLKISDEEYKKFK